MGQNSVCHGVTLPFSELYMEAQLALFRRNTRLSLWAAKVSGPLMTIVSLRSPSPSLCLVSIALTPANTWVTQVWKYKLFFRFYFDNYSQIVSTVDIIIMIIHLRHVMPNNNVTQRLQAVNYYIRLRDIVYYRRSDAWLQLPKQENSKPCDRLNVNGVRKEHELSEV